MIKMLKKTLATLLVLLSFSVLSGCGGSGDGGGGSELQPYNGGEFGLNVDPSWKVIGQSDFYADIPKETLVAFTTPDSLNGFFTNVSVVRENLRENVSALDYARANINLAGQNLTDYQKVQEVQVENSGNSTLIHIFQARLNPTEKLIRFVQLYNTKGNFGYIVTGGMLPDTPKEVRDHVGAMVTSFALR